MDEIPTANKAYPACPRCTKGVIISYCYQLPNYHSTFALKLGGKLLEPRFTIDLGCTSCGWKATISIAEQDAQKKPRTVPERERIVALVVEREEVKLYGKGEGPYQGAQKKRLTPPRSF